MPTRSNPLAGSIGSHTGQHGFVHCGIGDQTCACRHLLAQPRTVASTSGTMSASAVVNARRDGKMCRSEMNETSMVTTSTTMRHMATRQCSRADALANDHARIIPQPPVELTVANIKCNHARSATLQLNASVNPPVEARDIERPPCGHVDAERLKRMGQLDTPTSDVRVIGGNQLHPGLSGHSSARFRDHAAIHFDLASQNQSLGALARVRGHARRQQRPDAASRSSRQFQPIPIVGSTVSVPPRHDPVCNRCEPTVIDPSIDEDPMGARDAFRGKLFAIGRRQTATDTWASQPRHLCRSTFLVGRHCLRHPGCRR